MQKLDSSTRGDGVEPLAHPCIGAGAGKESPCERTVVQTSAANENRPVSTCVDAFDGREGITDESRGGVLLDRVHDIDQMVGNAALLAGGYLVGADVEAAVDGGGIATDDFAAALESQRDPERAFARGGWTKDGENRRAQTYILKKTSRTRAPSRINRPSC